jgi:hypothetical protein
VPGELDGNGLGRVRRTPVVGDDGVGGDRGGPPRWHHTLEERGEGGGYEGTIDGVGANRVRDRTGEYRRNSS